MSTYYFTYEGDKYSLAMKKEPRKQYFNGGWTEVTVDGDLNAAISLYWAMHPEELASAEYSGYDWHYDEERFPTAFRQNGINGYKCVERITMNVEVLERGAVNVG